MARLAELERQAKATTSEDSEEKITLNPNPKELFAQVSQPVVLAAPQALHSALVNAIGPGALSLNIQPQPNSR